VNSRGERSGLLLVK
jgi:hypothetical protein